MTKHGAQRSGFRLVRDQHADDQVRIFCGHCGRRPAPDTDLGKSRVCPACGLGLLLEASASIAPTPDDPFLVVDSSLAVCALSRRAERLLGLSETEAVNRHINDLLVSADAESANESLAAALVFTARGEGGSRNVVVRPANAFGVRYWARIGMCGPHPAALIVLAVV